MDTVSSHYTAICGLFGSNQLLDKECLQSQTRLVLVSQMRCHGVIWAKCLAHPAQLHAFTEACVS